MKYLVILVMMFIIRIAAIAAVALARQLSIKPENSPVVYPNIGETWTWNTETEDDPWAKPRTKFKIVDIKNGWARQDYGNCLFSIKIADLVKYYKRVQEDDQDN